MLRDAVEANLARLENRLHVVTNRKSVDSITNSRLFVFRFAITRDK